MKRSQSAFLLILPVLLPLARTALALDPTVGLCTRKDDMSKALETIDPLVQELSSAADEASSKEAARRIAAAHGIGRDIECLIRYREPRMSLVFLELLANPSWPVRARALYGLKMTGDESAVPAVAAMFADEEPKVRELAANCLCHIASAVPSELRAAAGSEKDPFVLSSIAAAIAVIESGSRPYERWAENLVGPEGARRVEWVWAIKGKSAYNRFDAKTLDYPKTDSFDWPISWYDGSLFCPVPRNSFGANGNHTGEDMAWFREGASVYAVADGLVRMIQGAGGDWGFLLAVEHQLTGGLYITAVYGHLGFDIPVKPGDVVKKGQKLGTVGMGCSVENGGYGAHLHFGLSDGPFRRPKGLFRGARINVNFQEENKTVTVPVIALVYNPAKRDEHDFPGLGIVVRFPDNTQRLLPANPSQLQDEVSWLQGYVPKCVGWHDPRKFIEAMKKREADGAGKDGGEPGVPPSDDEPGPGEKK